VNGWRTVELGNAAEFVRGINFKPVNVVQLGTPGSVACMRTKNVQTELDCSDVWGVDGRFVRREDQFLEAGDILVSSANSWNLVGKCCWIPDLPWRATFGGFVSVLRPQRTKVEPRFLFRWFSSGRIQTTVRSFGQQTTNISNLNTNRCLKLPIPLPALEEQRRIAAILDKAHELRTKRCFILAQLDTLSRGIFLDLFGDPASNPKSWPVVPFGEVGENQDSQRVPVKSSDRDNRKGQYPYYGASGIIDRFDDYIFDGERLLIGEDGANLIARVTPVAYIARGKYWVNNHAHVIADNKRADLRFLERFIELIDLKPYISGTAQPKLNRSNLDRIPLPFHRSRCSRNLPVE
jgi:restriction endonuclease S subunit